MKTALELLEPAEGRRSEMAQQSQQCSGNADRHLGTAAANGLLQFLLSKFASLMLSSATFCEQSC